MSGEPGPDGDGQGMTEYLIILVLIAIAVLGVFSFFGQDAPRQAPAGVVGEPASRPAGKDPAGAPAKAAEAKAAGHAQGAVPDQITGQAK